MPVPAFVRSVALAAASVLLLAPSGWAQHPSVIVDWSALDAAGPATDEPASVIALRPPPKRPAAAAPVAAKSANAGNAASQSAPAPAAAPPARVAMAVPPPPPPPAASAPPPAAPSAIPAAAPALLPGRAAMVRFAVGRSEIPAEGRDVLNAVAAQLAANGKLRLQLVGYASGSSDDAVEARRLSLLRAVQMRTYLIEKGVQSVRMDVRALGNRSEGGDPADRVDLVILDH